MSVSRPCTTCGQSFSPRGKDRYCSPACRCGTDAGYGAGCHCDRCKAAHARRQKQWRCIPKPRVDAIGTHRRIQALARLGWSTAELSHRIGRTRNYLLGVLRNGQVEADTARLVADLYDRLSMTRCTSRTAGRTASDALRRGWPAPLDWDDIDDPGEQPVLDEQEGDEADPIVVERILAGDGRLEASYAERVEVVRRWRGLGRSINELERLTGWQPQRYYEPIEQQLEEVAA